MMIPGISCQTCVFWVPTTHVAKSGTRLGQCRAHAPVLVTGSDGRHHSNWPLLGEQDWCGDHAMPEGDAK